MKNIKGLTLIELIIALAIIGIIVVTFLPIFTTSYTTIFGMGNRTDAVAIAQEIIDDLYVNPPSEAVSSQLVHSVGQFRAYKTVSVHSTGLFLVEVKVENLSSEELVTLRSLVP